VFILLASGLGISWLTGRETHRSEYFMALGGLGSLLFYGFDMPLGQKIEAVESWGIVPVRRSLCRRWTNYTPKKRYGSVRGVGGNAHPYRESVGILEHGMIKQLAAPL